MPTQLKELVAYLDEQLQVQRFKDYCPNGLQVEGGAQVSKLVTGVTANQALLDAAVECGADAVMVHHGYFWRGESPVITGMKRRRLGTLLANNLSLLAYHLPLDAHPEWGNNACFGRLLGIDQQAPLDSEDSQGVGSIGSLQQPVQLADLVEQVNEITGRKALCIGDEGVQVQRIAWCTGAAQGYIETALSSGAEVFISGEVSEQTVHVAREEGIHFIAAGHHATERYGVQAVGEHLASTFGIEHRYIDIDNPV